MNVNAKFLIIIFYNTMLHEIVGIEQIMANDCAVILDIFCDVLIPPGFYERTFNMFLFVKIMT